MVIGSKTHCAKCGASVVSCVIPAYCGKCDPDIQAYFKKLEEADKPDPKPVNDGPEKLKETDKEPEPKPVNDGPEKPITIHLQMGPEIYRRLKSEAMVYLFAHAGDSLDIVNAWGWVFKQIDKDVCNGVKEVNATLGMKGHLREV